MDVYCTHPFLVYHSVSPASAAARSSLPTPANTPAPTEEAAAEAAASHRIEDRLLLWGFIRNAAGSDAAARGLQYTHMRTHRATATAAAALLACCCRAAAAGAEVAGADGSRKPVANSAASSAASSASADDWIRIAVKGWCVVSIYQNIIQQPSSRNKMRSR